MLMKMLMKPATVMYRFLVYSSDKEQHAAGRVNNVGAVGRVVDVSRTSVDLRAMEYT